MADSLDDIFKSGKALKVGGEDAPSAPEKEQTLEDLFGGKPSAPKFKAPNNSPESVANLKEAGKVLMVPALGALDGYTGGYGSRAYSQDMKKAQEEHPLLNAAGYIPGAIFGPGGKIAKGVDAVKMIPKGGAIAGGAAGLIEGLLTDPGEGKGFDVKARLNNGMAALGLGTGFGFGAKLLRGAGEQSKTYDALAKPGFAKSAKAEIDSALKQLMAKEVTPRKAELEKLLEGTTVDINPEFLKGFKRDATLGPVRDKGGLDRYADLLLKRSKGIDVKDGVNRAGGQVEIKGKNAQRLKQYFDANANYSKQKPFSDAANAKGDRSKAMADLMRKKVSALNPKVNELNEPMSEALNLRSNIKASSESSPIETLTADPMSSKGQQLLDLDQLAGTKLSKRGQDIAAAKKSRISPSSLLSVSALSSAVRGGKRLTGKTLGPLESVAPVGTKEALIQKILDSMQSSSSEE